MRQIELLGFVVSVLDRLGVPYAIVGSYASGTWGEPRMTRDIDIAVSLSHGKARDLCAAFPAADFYVSDAAAEEAVRLRGQFNVIHPKSGNKVDFMVVGDTGWAAAQLTRRMKVCFEEGSEGYVASPEDVILGKLVYYREGQSEKHLRDIAGILSTSGDMVDRTYVAKYAAELGVAEIWQAVQDRVDRKGTAG